MFDFLYIYFFDFFFNRRFKVAKTHDRECCLPLCASVTSCLRLEFVAKVSNTSRANLFFCSLLVKGAAAWLCPEVLKFEAKKVRLLQQYWYKTTTTEEKKQRSTQMKTLVDLLRFLDHFASYVRPPFCKNNNSLSSVTEYFNPQVILL